VRVKTNDSQFMRDMDNIIKYSTGFLDGISLGKKQFLENVGRETIEMMKDYIDVNARLSPGALHHMYEWNQVGSPAARLFNLDYTVSGIGLSISSTFSQSRSVKSGSRVPFYNKATIMEKGVPVTITPKKNGTLVFNDNGETVFTKSPVTVKDPGGKEVQGSYERVFDSFFNNYFKQSFLKASGIMDYLQNPQVYKQNLSRGKSLGRSHGISVGYKWIANAGRNN
jgi:hypothetical protein